MTPGLRPLAQLLVESVTAASGPLPAGVEDLSADALMAAGFLHQVRPALRRRVAAAPVVPDEWGPAFEIARRGQLFRQVRAMHDLRLCVDGFQGAGVRWAVAKGPVLANTVWPHPDMREFSDLDVLVHPADFGMALATLEDLGATYVDRNWPEILRQGRAELALRGRPVSPSICIGMWRSRGPRVDRSLPTCRRCSRAVNRWRWVTV